MTAILTYGDRAAREVSARFGGTYANAAAITALVAGDRADGMVVVDAATRSAWAYNASSNAVAGVSVLVPDDAPATGRWLSQVIANGNITPSALAAAATMTGVGAVGVAAVPVQIYAPVAAGATGNADDVVITTSLPFACLVIDVRSVVTTVGAGDTWTIRDTVGGAGTALSDAMSVAVAGIIPWAVTALPAAVAAGSDIYVRRTDDTSDGAVLITLLPV